VPELQLSFAKELHQLCFETCRQVCLGALAALTKLLTNQLANGGTFFDQHVSVNAAPSFEKTPATGTKTCKRKVSGCACIVLRSTEPNKKRGSGLWATSDTMQSLDKHAT
jgi:hypothetical protein